MKIVRHFPKLYLALLIVANCLVISTQVLDRPLVPRFLFLILVSLLGLGILLSEFFETKKTKKRNKKNSLQLKSKPFVLTIFDICFVAYYLISAFSVLFAINKGEVFFELQKIFLTFFNYYVLRFLLLKNKEKTEKFIFNCVATVTTFLLAYLLWELYEKQQEMGGFRYVNLYVQGLSGHRNLFASFLLFCLPLNFLGWLQVSNKLLKKLFLALLVLQISTLIFLQTRNVYVALLLSSLFLVIGKQLTNPFITSQNLKKFAAIGFGVLLFSTITLSSLSSWDYVLKRINILDYSQSKTGQERQFVWDKTLKVLGEKNRWLTGIGLGNWRIVFPSQGIGEWERIAERGVAFQRPHNDFLWIWSEAGILALATYLGLFGLVFWAGLGTIFRNKDNILANNKLWVILAGILSYLSISMFSFPKERIEHQIVMSVLFALAAYYSHAFYLSKKHLKFQMKPLVLLALVVPLLGFSAFVGYVRYQGEAQMKHVYGQENNPQKWAEIIKYSQAAYHPFYSLDYTGKPIKWFEGQVYFKQKKFDLALEKFLTGLKDNPYSESTLHDTAIAYAEKKDYINTEKYILKVLEINSKHDLANETMSYLRYLKKDYTAAAKFLNKVRRDSKNKTSLSKSIQQQLNAQN